ncbi:DinB superfamily protein [Filimonas lacunae]|uniref:DinB superfamily protein n=1 Tax=Filimonas lacunae TaxID=477680 RepID=A0A173MQC1_9BACT|nr:DinB family protein [Filimonas lacunae]BAV09844.1 hypothetical protein FLA_5897 [Filimonas lacunae]SIS79821.1 DinB superfamily protein [Filimonas lacunae]
MSLLKNIAQHVLDVHLGDNWTDVNIKDTLKGVTYKEAISITIASPNSIAMLLHHLTFYNEVVLQRLLDIYEPIPQSNGFDMPRITTEEGWQQLQHKNRQSAHALAEGILQFPEERLFELTANGQTTFYKNLHGVVEHAHYHLGQIVILKHLV